MKRLHNDNRNETADFVLHESTMQQMRYLTMEARGRLMTMMADIATNGGKAAHGGKAALSIEKNIRILAVISNFCIIFAHRNQI